MMDEFRVKSTEHDYTVTITYDRWGGMKIVKQSSEDGTNRYQEVYFPREAMMDLAVKLLKKECC